MIRNEGNRSVMACDTAGCENEVRLTNRGFQKLANEARNRGWLVEPDGDGSWWHTCWECQGVKS